ncbi:DNA polymerase/3'-5' exonuclease PolX [Solitalea koreensis]|uniref:DNA polymerase (Family 10) n=1 Tax=Solitalea koreensis TaxID=543615 RepID=A0A521D930_9SPHI|nr:DNA polymerase/3'-5' exonuclease PolX [Solitalea koreensis]SMO68188.1 DNA polymerase (family 10) [Solitalea koreensis]
MENKQIARTLRLLSQLMELHEENSFKIKSVANAAFKIDKSAVKISGLDLAALEKVDGIGKSIAQKVHELNTTGRIEELVQLLQLTPEGVVSMLNIKGIGPKKIQIIWKQLEIETIGELYYACNENRLIEAKGFGLKTQEEIKRIIEFSMSNVGKLLYVQAEELLNRLEPILASAQAERIAKTGEFARNCEIVEELAFVVATKNPTNFIAKISENEHLLTTENTDLQWNGTFDNFIIKIYFCPVDEFEWTLFQTIGSPKHLELMQPFLKGHNLSKAKSQEEIYKTAGLQYIPFELREGTSEIELAKEHKIPQLIGFTDLKGALHNHSTYSDGIHSLREMATYCKELGYEYLGMCDHSKSAFYANGLSEERIFKQHAEIDALNKELAPFRIFKGIESDILYDGSLDYSDEILASFDLVVASVHSQLKMTEEKANSRLIKAIENPFTTILGHPTGRLLLARTGYPINHKLIIDACAANNVIIELNANPLRLDMDWRWINYALSKDVMISINPDAHRKEGFHDMFYGVKVAQKAGLTKEMCFNALSLEAVLDKLETKNSKTV